MRGRDGEIERKTGSSGSCVLRGSFYVLVDFSGITPVSNETCTHVAIIDTLHLPGETESVSAGTQPDKGSPGILFVHGAAADAVRGRFLSSHWTPERCLRKSILEPQKEKRLTTTYART